jgi:serine/threonine protein kinase
MDKLTEDFLAQFDSNEFPKKILFDYEPLELLSVNERAKTFLLRRKADGKKVIAKCYDKTIYNIKTTEFEFLRDLSHAGLSEFIGTFEDSRHLFVFHHYVEGVTLNRYVEDKKPPDNEIIHIVVQLCDILTYLHNQTPPIIHRDIKPSNIIINEGKITLIDFGTSRRFDNKQKEDTLYLGTRGFAPPEQYGYAQTDSRADIYAVGILLLYLCSGNIDLKNIQTISNKRFAAAIKKSTEFSPDNRYKSAAALKAALLNEGYFKNNKLRFSIAACVLLIGAWSFAGDKFFDSPHALPTKEETKTMSSAALSVPMKFESSLVEQAVRQILHKSAAEQITEDELLQIDQLLIAGNKPSSSIQEYYSNLSLFYQKDGSIKNGDISILTDIEKMPNLIILCLPFQQITDISALKGMQMLEKLELNGNPIMDIGPLSELKTLQTISLQETRVADTTPLNALEKLRYININGNRCHGYEFLRYVGDIEYLDLSFAAPEKILPLLNGKMVRNFQFSYADLYSLAGFEKIVGLETLDIQKSRITDISAIKGITSLISVNLAENPIEDLSPLLALPNLRRAEFSRDMESKVNAQLQNAAFDIAYR